MPKGKRLEIKKLLLTGITVLFLATGTAHTGRADEQIEMPRAFQGEWCTDGGSCPNVWMTVTKRGFVAANGIRCDLQKAVDRAPLTEHQEAYGLWALTFKCTNSKKPADEMWFFAGEALIVTFALDSRTQRFVQYLPRINRDQG